MLMKRFSQFGRRANVANGNERNGMRVYGIVNLHIWDR